MIINSHGGNYINTVKAIPLEIPTKPLAKEPNSSQVNDVDQNSNGVEHTVTLQSNSSQLSKNENNSISVNTDNKGEQMSTEEVHSVALSQDTKTLKNYIEMDYMKEYAFSLRDQPDAQQSKQFYLDAIEILFRECSRAGGMLHNYTVIIYNNMGSTNIQC